MLIPDVNVLMNAARPAAAQHAAALRWLLAAGAGDEPVGVPFLVLLAFARISTTPMQGTRLMTVPGAFARCEEIRVMPNYTPLTEGSDHWRTFRHLVTQAGVSGADLTDAYLAAFAIENDATFVTFDRGFARFAGLKVLVPA